MRLSFELAYIYISLLMEPYIIIIIIIVIVK